MSTTTLQLGDFTIFGFTKDGEGFLNSKLSTRLGISPRVINFGTAGDFFFYSSSGDVAESEEAIALKLGYVRSRTRSPLSTQQLLDQKIVGPNFIDHDAFWGNALLACFNKLEPCFSIYQTIMALPQLYYTRLGGEILCATDIRCLLALLEEVQLNEDIVPMHFLFEIGIGPATYFRDIWRLFPGQKLKWNDGRCQVSLEQDLRLPTSDPKFDRIDSTSIAALYGGMSEVMGAYLTEMKRAGDHPGNLLSGGVDSSVIQLLLNEQLSSTERVSFSYIVQQASSFEFEVEYARHASEIFETQHTFCHILPENYPALLIRTIETLGQPNLYNEGEPCKLALAEFLAANATGIGCYFAGQAADALHGLNSIKKMALFDSAKQIPGARLALQWGATLLAPWARNKSHGLEDVAKMLAEADNPKSLTAPPNNVAIGDLQMARRCFGDQALLKAFDYRCNLEMEYLNSPSMMEKTQVIDLLTAGYEPAVVGGQLFSAFHKKLIQFYLDEEVIRMTLAFDPQVRFKQGNTLKPLQKEIMGSKGYSELAKKKKGGSTFKTDLCNWMNHGVLQEMVHEIDLPDSISKSELDRLAQYPCLFLWNLLTFDIFRKHVLKSRVEWKNPPLVPNSPYGIS